MSITKMNGSALRLIRERINQALESLGEELNVSFATGNARYTPDSATFKLNVSIIDSGGVALRPEVTDFNIYASRYGLKPSDLGRKFRTYSGLYEITGCRPRSPKYPILGKDVNSGKAFKFAPHSIKHNLI